MSSLLFLLIGCAVFITDEEYAQRLTHSLDGELVIPDGVLVPATGEVVLFPLNVDVSAPIPDTPEPWVKAPLDGLAINTATAFSLSIPAAPEDAMLSDGAALDAPGAQVALFALGAWSDLDADGAMTTADTYIALDVHNILVWFDVGQDSAAAIAVEELGAAPGYNIGLYDAERQRFTAYDPVPSTKVVMDLDANLALQVHSTLDLTIESDIVRDQIRADLFHYAGEEGVEAPTLMSVAVPRGADPVLVKFVGDFGLPPADHLSTLLDPDGAAIDLAPYGLEVAVYGAIVYQDSNDNGQIDTDGQAVGEIALGRSVDLDGDGNLAFFLRPTHFRAAVGSQFFGSLGWTLIQSEANNTNAVREWAQGLTIEGLLLDP